MNLTQTLKMEKTKRVKTKTHLKANTVNKLIARNNRNRFFLVSLPQKSARLFLAGLVFLSFAGCKKDASKNVETSLTLSGTVSGADQPTTLLTTSLADGQVADEQSFNLVPAGKLDIYCSTLEATPTNCKLAVSTTGTFEGACPGLGGKALSCNIRNDEKVVARIFVDNMVSPVVGSGILKADIQFDVATSYASATVNKTTSTAVVSATKIQPFGKSLSGNWKVACATAETAAGFSGTDRCPADQTLYFNELDVSRVGIWESKAAYEACGSSDAHPAFKFVFNGDTNQTVGLEYASQATLFTSARESVSSVLAAAPAPLRTALEATAAARTVAAQAALAAIPAAALPASFVVPTLANSEQLTAAIFDLMSLSNADLDAAADTCAALADKADALAANTVATGTWTPLAHNVLCGIISSTELGDTVTWLKKTRAASCLPKIDFGRLYNATGNQLVESSFCGGSGNSGACVDANGTYLGQVATRLGIVKMRSYGGNSIEMSRLGAESLKVINGASGLQTCKNLDQFALSGWKASDDAFTGTVSALVVNNCRETGRARNTAELLSDGQGAKNLASSWTATFTRQP